MRGMFYYSIFSAGYEQIYQDTMKQRKKEYYLLTQKILLELWSNNPDSFDGIQFRRKRISIFIVNDHLFASMPKVSCIVHLLNRSIFYNNQILDLSLQPKPIDFVI